MRAMQHPEVIHWEKMRETGDKWESEPLHRMKPLMSKSAAGKWPPKITAKWIPQIRETHLWYRAGISWRKKLLHHIYEPLIGEVFEEILAIAGTGWTERQLWGTHHGCTGNGTEYEIDRGLRLPYIHTRKDRRYRLCKKKKKSSRNYVHTVHARPWMETLFKKNLSMWPRNPKSRWKKSLRSCWAKIPWDFQLKTEKWWSPANQPGIVLINKQKRKAAEETAVIPSDSDIREEEHGS